jgi:hypothetical protein
MTAMYWVAYAALHYKPYADMVAAARNVELLMCISWRAPCAYL